MTKVPLDELIIGRSPAIQELRNAIRRAASKPTPVLIQGPTGAGKELVAQGLHAESGRTGRFIGFNVAGISESLFESELLGHVRGAFSGAVRDRAGLLRSARNGTAFVDEIGDLPMAAQAKLLRVIETREVFPVGSDVAEHVDFRLVTATNVNLAKATDERRFRADLMFRLQRLVITVPALRDHREDIIPLAAYFANVLSKGTEGPQIKFTASAMSNLERYDWPGNVRELRHAVEHAAFIAEGATIGEIHVKQVLAWRGAGAADTHSRSSEVRGFLELLADSGGSVDAVAKALGVDRSTVYRRMLRLGVTRGFHAQQRKASVEKTSSTVEPVGNGNGRNGTGVECR
jgi:two-component system response regulator HydG